MNSEQLCKDVCANNETCVGTYWGFDSDSKSVTCFLQVTTGGGAGGMTGANHSFHSNCTGTVTTQLYLYLYYPSLRLLSNRLLQFSPGWSSKDSPFSSSVCSKRCC